MSEHPLTPALQADGWSEHIITGDLIPPPWWRRDDGRYYVPTGGHVPPSWHVSMSGRISPP